MWLDVRYPRRDRADSCPRCNVELLVQVRDEPRQIGTSSVSSYSSYWTMKPPEALRLTTLASYHSPS
eukprot:scaffold665230_cov50-Prasinocladus_malaysianus.AAC.1